MVKGGRHVLKSSQNPFSFKYSLIKINSKNVKSFERSGSTEMICVQKLGVPVLFCTIAAVLGSLKSSGKGIGFYLQLTQPLLDSRSNPNYIQPMFMNMMA